MVVSPRGRIVRPAQKKNGIPPCSHHQTKRDATVIQCTEIARTQNIKSCLFSPSLRMQADSGLDARLRSLCTYTRLSTGRPMGSAATVLYKLQ